MGDHQDDWDADLPFQQIVGMLTGVSGDKDVILRLSLQGTQRSDLQKPPAPVQLVLPIETALRLAEELRNAVETAGQIQDAPDAEQ